jgi:hypothetical protein
MPKVAEFKQVDPPEVGFYIVTQDVTNPHPDRRTRDDWVKAEIVPKGLRIQIEEFPMPLVVREIVDDRITEEVRQKIEAEHKVIRVATLVSKGLGIRLIINHKDHPKHQALWVALVHHLEPLRDDVGTILKRYSNCVALDTVVAQLLESGMLTMDQVSVAAKAVYDLDEETDEQLRRKWGILQ